jgi:hypothetical protein
MSQPQTAPPTKSKHKHRRGFLYEHSLSITSILILLSWIVLYIFSNPSTHWGSFFGNAIADWSGVVVTVLATKFLYEKGSAESRPCPEPEYPWQPAREFLVEHSLSIFLLLTGIGWVVWFVRSDPTAKWGQVIGNIVSEWTQIFGLVLLTKRMIEKHSKESR